MKGSDNRGRQSFRSQKGGESFEKMFGSYRFNASPREMHKATCSECGNECEVPFKPSNGKPVFCRQCFANKKKQ